MTNITTILAPALAAARTPAQREALADELERIAAQLRQTAEAQRRQQARPPAQRVIRRHGGGRPSTPWVRVQSQARAGQADRLFLQLSASLYYAIGSPERLDVQRVGGALHLIPARGDTGYKAIVNVGGIRINASGSRDIVRLDPGKYAARVDGGVVVVDDVIDK